MTFRQGEALLMVCTPALLLSVYFQQGVLTSLLVLIMFTVGTSYLWAKRSLLGFEIDRRPVSPRVFAGENVDYRVVAANEKWLPLLGVEYREAKDHSLRMEGREDDGDSVLSHRYFSERFSLAGQQKMERHYRLRAMARGLHRLGPAYIKTGDPLGLFQQDMVEKDLAYVLVYPQVLPLDDLHLASENPFGAGGGESWIFKDPSYLKGIRRYRPGDQRRHIHWWASARNRGLMTKEFDAIMTRQLVVALDVSMPEDMFEVAVSAAASSAYYGHQRGYEVELWTNGKVSRQDLALLKEMDRRARPQGGKFPLVPSALERVFNQLALVTRAWWQTREEMVYRLSEELDFGASVVLVTGVHDESGLRRLAAPLSRGRHQLNVLVVGEEPTDQVSLHSFNGSPPAGERAKVTYLSVGQNENVVGGRGEERAL